MPSSPQTVPTVVLFDYLLNDAGVAIANARVTVVLVSTKPATSISPPTSIAQTQQSTTTDANGYWTFNLIPNGNINPANTTYTVQTPDSAYDVTLGSVGPYQSTAFGTIVNVPVPLTTASSSIASLLVAAGEPGIDTAAAGALLLGDNNATSIELGTATNTQGLLTAAAGEVISGGTGATLNASGDLAVRSVTVSSGSGPYTPSAPAGGIQGVRYAGPPSGTDDTTMIQNALTAINTAGGGEYVLSFQGTYISQPLTIYSNTTLRILAGVTLQLKNAQNASFISPPVQSGAFNKVSIFGPGTIGATPPIRQRASRLSTSSPAMVSTARWTASQSAT